MSDSATLPPNWIRLQTVEGRPYYHCRTTGETTWTPPTKKPPSTPGPYQHPSSKPVVPSPLPANTHSLYQLILSSQLKEREGHGLFELERDKLLRITLNSRTAPYAWIKLGSMVARSGKLKFSRQTIRDQGLGRIMKKALTGEGVTLVKCQGTGVAYCAHMGKRISVLQLTNEKLYLNGNDVLALSSSLTYDIKLMRVAAMLAGGLFNVEVSGTGMVAFTCHGAVYVLEATPQNPIYTDPNATVAWTHMPTLRTDLTIRSFIGRGSGEEFQLAFTRGFVVVQPYEEKYYYGAQYQH